MVEDKYQVTSAADAVSWFTGKSDVERYEALLSYQSQADDKEGEENVDYVTLVQYTIKSSINNTIDSYEQTILDTDSADENFLGNTSRRS